MQDGCKVYVDSYIASIGSCLHDHWTIFNDRETLMLRTLTTVVLFYLNICEDPLE